jgi:hypothetical protein
MTWGLFSSLVSKLSRLCCDDEAVVAAAAEIAADYAI